MLGELLGEQIGQTTGTRVLPSEDGSPRIEVSFQANGTLLGTQTVEMGTFIAVNRPDGTLFGTGQGVLTTDDGDMATWAGNGVGRPAGRGGSVSWRGAIYYQTSSERLTRLNSIAAIFEFEVDETGKTEAKSYEWK